MSMLGRSLVLLLLLPAGALACSSSGTSPSAAAPAQAPGRTTVDGKLARLLVSPTGDVDGAVLQDGTVARFRPGALSPEGAALRPGDAIRIEGDAVSAGAGRVLTRASLSRGDVVLTSPELAPPGPPPRGPAAGGPPPPPRGGRGRPRDPREAALASMTVTGKVQGFSTDPKGRVDGILLDDGTSARAGRKARLETLGLKPGDTVTITGRGGTYPQGRSLHIETVKLPSGELRAVERPRAELAPVTHEGAIARALLNPHGDVDGLVLADRALVRLRPLAPTSQLTPGAKVRAEGIGTSTFIDADRLVLTATNAVLDLSVAPSPRATPPQPLPTLEDTSVVAQVLAGPDGDVDTLILQDGAIVKLPPGLRDDVGDAIHEGTPVTVHGEGGTFGAVKALRADRVQLASGQIFSEPAPPSGLTAPPNVAP